MYQLFCARNTYAMGPHVLLEEMGVAYELREVSLFTDKQPNAFRSASPHFRVPALVHPGGTLFESGAIGLFLAERHFEAGFGIAPDHPVRGEFLQWLFYLSSTVQPEVLIQFHPEFYAASSAERTTLKMASMKRLKKIWAILDRAYAGKSWLCDDRPTVVDVLLGVQLQWSECFENDITEYPNLQRMLVNFTDRVAVKEVMRWHFG